MAQQSMMGMNVSQIGLPTPVPAETSVDSKRAMLQSLLLKKSLENQQQSADAISREIEGKGQSLDIRC